jgi:predicted dehydrogenase
MINITRRSFMTGTLAAGAAMALPRSSFSQVRGASDDVRVAVVGLNNQGKNHIKWFHRLKGVRVVAICDPDKSVLDREVKLFEERKEKVDTYVDYRKLLEDKNIDAIVTATPNHWHALITIWGCQAGKDVYVEKPVSYNIWEGRKMVEAARKYNRIVQAGTQRRSDEGIAEVVQYLREGNLGKMQLARCFYYSMRNNIGKVKGPQPIPESMDYNLWTGPAKMEPLMRERLHYHWHWVWNTGNGELGNNGVHYTDLCRWILRPDKLPKRVLSLGSRFAFDDDGQTPNTHIVFLDYQPVPILIEIQNLPRKKGDKAMGHYKGARFGPFIQCEHGYYTGGWAYDNDGKKIKQFPLTGGRAHHMNFINAVRSRKVEDLNADILEGHLSTSLCHMGNISHRVGQESPPEKILESIKGNKGMTDAFGRFQEHLLANEIDVKKTPWTLGASLQMDSNKERFVGEFSEQANMYLRREYRKPFVVPKQV